MGLSFFRKQFRLLFFFINLMLAGASLAYAQGLFLNSPSNGLPPTGLLVSDTVTLTDGMFRNIVPPLPYLRLGYSYTFGNAVRSGRALADYTFPIRTGIASTLFGEAHAEFQDFWRAPSVTVSAPPGSQVVLSPTKSRVDLSFGGGYRTMLNDNLFLGLEGFYDTSRLFNKWYSGGGWGLQLAYNTSTTSAVDLKFNWYGNLFGSDGFINAFRNRRGSWDVEGSYRQGILRNNLDLRLRGAGYQFDVINKVYGYRLGADLTTADGLMTLRYDYGYDRLNSSYHSITARVDVGFHLDDLFQGKNPFSLPHRIFGSPRILSRMLDLPAERNWHQPAAVVQLASASTAAGKRLVLTDISLNDSGGDLVSFVPNVAGQSWTATFNEGGATDLVVVNYQVQMSDGSLTTLGGIVTPAAGGPILVTNQWDGSGTQNAIPTPMVTSPQDLSALGGFGLHRVVVNSVAGNTVSGTVVIFSTDPTIAPLVINFTMNVI